MKLQYFGHSFWGVITPETSLVIDPFDNIGYPMPQNLTADFVFVSHEHHDHNNVALIKGKPEVIRKPGTYERKGFTAELIPVYHDGEYGAQRGRSNLIKITAEGKTLVHCGDLGHLPSRDIMDRINQPDLLLIPVGETYTLALEDVWKLIDYIHPRLIFPMHYSTPPLSFRLGSLEAFTRKLDNVVHTGDNTIEITPELLASTQTVIMNWSGKG